MLLHFDDAAKLTGAKLHRRDRLVLLYGIHHTFEFDCIYGPDNTPLPIQARDLKYWKLTITKTLSTPSEVLASAEYFTNIAADINKLSFDFSTATEAMYRYVAGNPNAPGVFELKGYATKESTEATCCIQFPLVLRTTVTNMTPFTLTDALLAEIQAAKETTLEYEEEAAAWSTNSFIWAEGTDEQVQALGGTHSAKGWAEIGSTGGSVAGLSNIIVNGSTGVVLDHIATVSVYVPTTLAELAGDTAHRTVSDLQTAVWDMTTEEFGEHRVDRTIHVLPDDRTYWNGKQEAINEMNKLPYSLVSGAPSIYDSTVTFLQGDDVKGIITLNQSTDSVIQLDEFSTPSVISVNGQTGAVVLDYEDVGAANAENYSATAISVGRAAGSVAGNYSIAFGENTEARGVHSYAIGFNTKATSGYQFVIGKYNDPKNGLLIVGNGSLSARSNALELSNSGDLLVSGSITDGAGNVLSAKANTADLSTVAFSNNYEDLINKPTIGAGVLSIVHNGVTSTFSANATADSTITIVGSGTCAVTSVNGKIGDVQLTYTDVNAASSTHTHLQTDIDGLTAALAAKANTADLATVAISGEYSDLKNKPAIPTVGDGTITLLQGGTTKGSFTVNQSTNTSIELDLGSAVTVVDVVEEGNTNAVSSGAVYTALSGHTSNTAVHVTAAEKTTWSGKIDPPTPYVQGHIYAYCNGAWVDITGRLNPEPVPTGTMLYGLIPAISEDITTGMTGITSERVAAAKTAGTIQERAAEAMSKTGLGAIAAGTWIAIYLPADSTLAAKKDDGFGNQVPFESPYSAYPQLAANGTPVTLSGVSYKVYGEYVSSSEDNRYIYIN